MGFRLVPKSVTLNVLEQRNGHYFALFRQIAMGNIRGQLRKLRKSGSLAKAINIYSPEKCHKVHQLSKTDALYSSLQVVHFGILCSVHHTLIFHMPVPG